MRLIFLISLLLSSGGVREGYVDENAKVKPLFNASYYESVKTLIEQSKKEIIICMFQFSYYPDYPASYSNDLAHILRKKAEGGVRIKILMEGGENYLGSNFSESLRRISKQLSHRNIEIKFDNRDKTTHAKFVIIDSKFVLVGSTNWTHYGLSENNESNVLIESKKVSKEFKSYFNTLWSKATYRNPTYFDTDKTVFIGVAKTVEKKISQRGRPYTIIYLEDGMRVYIKGHHNFTPGMKLKIEGKITKFRGKEQIDAYRIEKI
ncbi:MAG: phospholipase D-like domain-containing protein [Candidatus Hydrothermia bacterium]|nr:hypothetical protein [Candidatus Hydrothermae bacterium]MDD3649324.1 phospholipase D-like domain-containing protein [Candidatus Hydrothermia bacterium]MDD5573368.1 phospholipase D-like domain-containing protein [Candidatus Hydrothermia bacterium]HOK22739.1 phospholipase D-like domain-containing protein [Candidatus Hydrothermia bacterium]HOL23448.1 phospholipase D-like domain-containing protein [Candidatus Hydrothermia bacterium]